MGDGHAMNLSDHLAEMKLATYAALAMGYWDQIRCSIISHLQKYSIRKALDSALLAMIKKDLLPWPHSLRSSFSPKIYLQSCDINW